MDTSSPARAVVAAAATVAEIVLGGAFRVERELARGATSRVLLVRERGGGRRLVVKAVVPGADAAERTRFRREIALARRVHHPNVVAVLGAGHVDGVDYFTMPYVEGDSLRERIARGPLPALEALHVARALADALHHAHRRGVVHRDVKPENVLLAGERPVLIDFGIACPIAGAGDRRITGAGLLVGTPTYMSPEQALGEHAVDGRTDVYALGCVLYEMLTGAPPFSGRADVVLCRRLCEPAPHPRARRRELSAEADAIVVRALAPLPGHRYPTAAAFATALDQLLRASPRPTSAWHTRGWRALLAPGRTTLA